MTAGPKYIILRAKLLIKKQMWHMIFFYVLFFFLVFRFVYYGRVTVNNGWNTSSAERTTVSEFIV